MSRASELLARPVMQAYSAAVLRSTKDVVRPAGMAHTRVAGAWPLHILFIGCGAAVGVGVLTHDLGIPGHLARTIAADTSRGVNIDVVVDTAMTPTSALATLSRIRVSHYDAIVIVLGDADAMLLTPIGGWVQSFRNLLGQIRDAASPHNETFVVAVPPSSKPSVAAFLPPAIAAKHVRRLNTAMAEICAETHGATLVALDTVNGQLRSVEVFRDQSRQIAEPISRALNHSPGTSARRVDVIEETARQKAVDELSAIDEAASRRLDRITALAQQTFGVSSAAVTIIDGQWQVYASSQNVDVSRVARRDALCTVTITGREALVINDTSIDPRFADNPLVTGEPHIRFYAGYPIEAPNGERVGALCLLHDEPREFTEENIIQLRTLALFAQDELWSEGYQYERGFGQRTGDDETGELLRSGFQLR